MVAVYIFHTGWTAAKPTHTGQTICLLTNAPKGLLVSQWETQSCRGRIWKTLVGDNQGARSHRYFTHHLYTQGPQPGGRREGEGHAEKISTRSTPPPPLFFYLPPPPPPFFFSHPASVKRACLGERGEERGRERELKTHLAHTHTHNTQRAWKTLADSTGTNLCHQRATPGPGRAPRLFGQFLSATDKAAKWVLAS